MAIATIAAVSSYVRPLVVLHYPPPPPIAKTGVVVSSVCCCCWRGVWKYAVQSSRLLVQHALLLPSPKREAPRGSSTVNLFPAAEIDGGGEKYPVVVGPDAQFARVVGLVKCKTTPFATAPPVVVFSISVFDTLHKTQLTCLDVIHDSLLEY